MAKKFDITDFSNLVSLETEQKYPEEVKLLRSVWHLISKGKIEMIMRQAELEPSAKPRSSDEPPEWIQTIRKLKEIDQRLSGINKLPDHLEKQIPKELQVFREFYFSLSEED